MKKLLLGFCMFCLVALACKNKTDKQSGNFVEPVNDTAKFYPVSIFINADIDSVSKSKFEIVKTVTVDKKQIDSATITIDEFKQLAMPFLQKDITRPSLKKWYKESIFRHLNTNSIIFNYTTPNKDLEVQGIDVNVDDNTNNLNRVDMRVFSIKNDSSIKENYTWVHGKKFYVAKYAEGKDGKGVSSTIEVTWQKN